MSEVNLFETFNLHKLDSIAATLDAPKPAEKTENTEDKTTELKKPELARTPDVKNLTDLKLVEEEEEPKKETKKPAEKKAENENEEEEEEIPVERPLKKEKELGELKSRFVSMASHEFRTPLSTIQSSAALIGRYTLTEQQSQREKHTARIKSSVTTLNTILNDFLSLSKIEQGEVILKIGQVQLGNFLRETSDEIEGLLKNGQVIRTIDETNGLVIETDQGILKNILFNLLSNAIKYSGEGVIECKALADPEKLRISVRDHGIGIPESEQKHLFRRFFRAHNATNIEGTGLGLYIVSGYVNLLKGSIDYHSEEGKGSTFTISIPLI